MEGTVHSLGQAVRRGALFSEDGSRLFSAENGLCDWTLGTSDESVHADVRQWGVRAIVAPESTVTQHVALGGGDGLIRFYDLQKDEFLPFQGYHEMNVGGDVDVTFSPDGRRVASAGPDGLKVWKFLPNEEHILDPDAPLDSTVTDIRIARHAAACLVVRRVARSSGGTRRVPTGGLRASGRTPGEYRTSLRACAGERPRSRGDGTALSGNGQRVAVFDDDNSLLGASVFSRRPRHAAQP